MDGGEVQPVSQSQRHSQSPLIVFGDDWQRHVSTLQHLFKQIVDRCSVIWVNSYGHRSPRLDLYDLRRAMQKVGSMIRGPATVLTPPVPWRIIEPKALPWHQSPLVRRWNDRSLYRDISSALKDLGASEAPVLITGTPVAVGLVGRLGERRSIYFCMDDYGELPGVSRDMIAPLEQELLKRVDGVVATAAALTEIKRPSSGRAFQLPQGVNFDHFAEPRALPPEMEALPRPILGFAGGVSPACDVDLLCRVAERHPEGSVVLVGPVSIPERDLARPNIHLLGPRPYADLPAFVQAFDVGLIPYVLNPWTQSVDPLKLLEYLAAGIPVVTTDIPEVRKYMTAVTVAQSPDEFVDAVSAAAVAPEKGRGERQQVARLHTWARRADRLMEIIEELDAELPVPAR